MRHLCRRSDGLLNMVRPCKGCAKEHKRCKGCDDWREWFPQAFDFMAAAIRELAPKPQPVTYRDIVYWTVFTELWR